MGVPSVARYQPVKEVLAKRVAGAVPASASVSQALKSPGRPASLARVLQQEVGAQDAAELAAGAEAREHDEDAAGGDAVVAAVVGVDGVGVVAEFDAGVELAVAAGGELAGVEAVVGVVVVGVVALLDAGVDEVVAAGGGLAGGGAGGGVAVVRAVVAGLWGLEEAVAAGGGLAEGGAGVGVVVVAVVAGLAGVDDSVAAGGGRGAGVGAGVGVDGVAVVAELAGLEVAVAAGGGLAGAGAGVGVVWSLPSSQSSPGSRMPSPQDWRQSSAVQGQATGESVVQSSGQGPAASPGAQQPSWQPWGALVGAS
jgi:hypothetical protein